MENYNIPHQLCNDYFLNRPIKRLIKTVLQEVGAV